jgi:hypothetical protein
MIGYKKKKQKLNGVMINSMYDNPNDTNLILSQGNVYGATYHTVEPTGGVWLDMEAWAIRAYGPSSSVWDFKTWAPAPDARWYMNNRKFWFRDPADVTLFLLRWS